MTTGLWAVTRDIDAALRAHGLIPRQLVLVSPLGERKGIRFAYRVDLAGGRTVKARHFGSEEALARVFPLHAALEAAFARALARHGPVLIEEWIEGTPLEDAGAEARAQEAGALLGRLHATPPHAGTPLTAGTGRWRAAAESDLARLDAARALPAAIVGRLRSELARRDPGEGRVVLIHKDFCAENMLVDVDGRLRVIDNEQLEIAPPGFDLGRTFHRWPMSADAHARFLRGYQATAPGEPDAVGFWRLVASLETTRVFLERRPERLETSLEILRRMADGAEPP